MALPIRLFKCLVLGGLTALALARPASAATYTTLYSFQGGSDGREPVSALLNVSGTLYGTTSYGGACAVQGEGCGTVFSITPSGSEQVVYAFKGGTDGAYPHADLIEVGGLLYSTTAEGGVCHNGRYGDCGTVFSVTTAGAERVLASFLRSSDGVYPLAGLFYRGNRLYGTASSGIPHGAGGNTDCGDGPCGGVFWVTLNGFRKNVYRFQGGNDGYEPFAGMIQMGGLLYGTTQLGGGAGCGSPAGGCGTVFSITPKGVEKVVYAFKGGSDGKTPYSSLIKVGDALYGTTYGGGTYDCGTVFKVTASGTESVIYSFAGGQDGSTPGARLLYLDGKLYGTTAIGGTRGGGTIFNVTLAGDERVLHSFGAVGGAGDGNSPWGGLIEVNGVLYGTTSAGGAYRFGTVFALSL